MGRHEQDEALTAAEVGWRLGLEEEMAEDLLCGTGTFTAVPLEAFARRRDGDDDDYLWVDAILADQRPERLEPKSKVARPARPAADARAS